MAAELGHVHFATGVRPMEQPYSGWGGAVERWTATAEKQAQTVRGGWGGTVADGLRWLNQKGLKWLDRAEGVAVLADSPEQLGLKPGAARS